MAETCFGRWLVLMSFILLATPGFVLASPDDAAQDERILRDRLELIDRLDHRVERVLIESETALEEKTVQHERHLRHLHGESWGLQHQLRVARGMVLSSVPSEETDGSLERRLERLEVRVDQAMRSVKHVIHGRAARGTGSISGMVTGTGSGVPLEGTGVHVYHENGWWVTSAYTDAAGAYDIPAVLDTSTYYLLAFDYDHGHIPEFYGGVRWNPNLSGNSGTGVAVSDGVNTPDIDFDLDPGARIEGAITESGSGAPLSSTRVEVYDSDYDYYSDGYPDGSGNYITGAGLPSGTFFAINWGDFTHLREMYDDVPCAGSGCDINLATPIALTEPETTSLIDFVLDIGGAITGNISGSDTGTGIDNSWVSVYDATGIYVRSGSANANGDYVVSPLPTGDYRVRVGNNEGYVYELYDDIPCVGGNCDVSTGTSVAVTAPTTTTGIDFVLDPGGNVSGTIVADPGGTPIEGVTVGLYDGAGSYLTEGYSDATGVYDMSLTYSGGLSTGTYYARTYNNLGFFNELYDDIPCGTGCDPTAGNPIAVTTGVVTSGIDFALSQGAGISGRVTSEDGGAGLESRVYLYDVSGSSFGSVWTDLSGAYTWAGLESGSYFLRTYNYQSHLDELYDNIPCAGGDCHIVAGTPVEATVGSTTDGIDFALVPGGTISGTVTDAGTGLGLDDVQINVYDSAGNNRFLVWSTSDGSYLTNQGLEAGNYFLIAKDSSGANYLGELYADIACPFWCNPLLGTAVSVAAGQTTPGIDFSLEIGGSFSGIVTDSVTGGPVRSNVQVFDSTGELVLSSYSSSSTGEYLARSLPPGTYFAILNGWYGYLDELWEDIKCEYYYCNPLAGTPIDVAMSNVPGVDFQLDKACSISGVVSDALTKGPIPAEVVAEAQVWLHDETGAFLYWTQINGTGQYSFQELEPGTYYVRTYNWEGFTDEVFDDMPCRGGCDVTIGTPLVLADGAAPTDVNFELLPSEIVFFDDFESGDNLAWDATSP